MFELLRKQKVAQFPQQEAITHKKHDVLFYESELFKYVELHSRIFRAHWTSN